MRHYVAEYATLVTFNWSPEIKYVKYLQKTRLYEGNFFYKVK